MGDSENNDLSEEENSDTNESIAAFAPAAEKFVDAQERTTQRRIEYSRFIFSRLYWLIVVIIGGFFALAAWLMIFHENGFDLGLSIITHVAAVLAGLIGGTGLARTKGSD